MANVVYLLPSALCILTLSPAWPLSRFMTIEVERRREGKLRRMEEERVKEARRAASEKFDFKSQLALRERAAALQTALERDGR